MGEVTPQFNGKKYRQTTNFAGFLSLPQILDPPNRHREDALHDDSITWIWQTSHQVSGGVLNSVT